jgi:hypothetical protein
MQQQGKFILLTLNEFELWLEGVQLQRRIKLIQNHHTWLPDYGTFRKRNADKHFSLLRSMETAHLARGFSEIGQNFTTFPDGKIAICRDLEKIPAGIKGANLHGICIEHVGNFDIGKDTMAKAHRRTIVTVNALLCEKFDLDINSDSIVYHHWYDLNTGKRVKEGTGTTKTCPGTNFFGGNTVSACETNFLPEVREALVAV